MELTRVLGTLALVAVLVPLSGCIGDDDTTPDPVAGSGGEIEKGIPPKKFTFEPLTMSPGGEAIREKKVTESGLPGPLGTTRTTWRVTWSVTGLTPLASSDETQSEAIYNVWMGKKTSGGSVSWEPLQGNASTAPDGTMSGASPWKPYYKDHVGVMITLESTTDNNPEIPVLVTTAMQSGNTDPVPLEYQKPFGPAFADARVVVNKDKSVNLTVNAFSLPETEGAYDVFLKNDDGTTFLGSLEFDAAVGGLSVSARPDPELFKSYQFFISLEQASDAKEQAGGFQVLISRFA